MTREKRDEPSSKAASFDFAKLSSQIIDGDVFASKKDVVGAALYQIAVVLESQNGTVNLRERDEVVASLRDSSKLLTRLGQIFRTCDHVDLVISTSCILANFAGETRKDAVAVVNLGILPVYESHLDSSNSQLRRWAVFAIGNIAWRGPALRDKLIGACPGLARNIAASADEYDKRAFFAIKSFFFQQDPQPKFETVDWALDVLKLGLASSVITDSEMVDSLRIMNILTAEWSSALIDFESGSLVKMLIYHVTDFTASVRKAAMDALRGLTRSKPEMMALFTDMSPRQTPRSLSKEQTLSQAETMKFNRLIRELSDPATNIVTVEADDDCEEPTSPETSIAAESGFDEEHVVAAHTSNTASTACTPNVLPSQIFSSSPRKMVLHDVIASQVEQAVVEATSKRVKKRRRTHVVIHNTFNITCETFKYYQSRNDEEGAIDSNPDKSV